MVIISIGCYLNKFMVKLTIACLFNINGKTSHIFHHKVNNVTAGWVFLLVTLHFWLFLLHILKYIWSWFDNLISENHQIHVHSEMQNVTPKQLHSTNWYQNLNYRSQFVFKGILTSSRGINTHNSRVFKDLCMSPSSSGQHAPGQNCSPEGLERLMTNINEAPGSLLCVRVR